MPRKPAVEQPIAYIGTYDRVRQIDCIVSEAEQGHFGNAALLVDQILRDDRIYSVLITRILGLLGKHLDFEPAKGPKSGEAQGRKIADAIESDWPKMFAQSALVDLLTWGIMLGVGFGQIIEERDIWRLEVWHPSNLVWDLHDRVYRIQPRGADRITLQQENGITVDDMGRKWLLFTPYGHGNAGRRGLLRALARLYLERQWARRDRGRYSEMHGQPIRFGMAPANATPAEITAFGEDLGNIGSDTALVGKQGEDGNKWDVKLIEAVGKSHELFQGELAELDKAIATLVLGQSQSTDGQAGLGSNDQAGELVRLDIMRADKDALSDALRAQFLVPYCYWAYSNGELAPWPCWQVDPPEDKAARAKVHLDQANADKTYIDAGVLTSEEVALSRFGKGDGEYSLDTEIDIASREAIKKLSAEQMKVEAEKALEDAKNPPEVVDVAVPAPGTPKNGTPQGAQPGPEAPAGA